MVFNLRQGILLQIFAAEALLIKLYGSDLGKKTYNTISTTAVKLYEFARAHAKARSIILADTKFEFGIFRSPSGEVILIDEVLTPDSSRYWAADGYEVGRGQESFDKQFLRDWLTNEAGFKKGWESGPNDDGTGWEIPEKVVLETKRKYEEAVERIMADV